MGKQYDLWAPILNYKKGVTSLKRAGVSSGASWAPSLHLRRLEAYEILEAYYNCYSRDFRMGAESGDAGNNDDVIEMRNPAWLCDKMRNKVLGGEVDVYMPIPKRFGSVGEIESRLAKTEDQALRKALEDRLSKLAEIEAITTMREEFLRDWFSDQMIYLQIDEAETLTSYLGDAVLIPYWDDRNKTVKVKVEDPGFCFPYYDCNDASWENPEVLCQDRFVVAWEEWSNSEEIKVWRDVYELRVVGNKLACYRQKAYFKIGEKDEKTILDLDPEMDLWDEAQDGSWDALGFDFVPAVWLPNVSAPGQPFGKSNLHGLLPLFDSMMNTDTDIANNSEHLGGATLIATGKGIRLKRDAGTKAPIPVSIQPNTLYHIGDDGEVTILDNSKMQDALLKTEEKYRNDLIRLSEITEIGAGLMKPSEAPSGVALAILLQPLMDKVLPMRDRRQQAYSNLFYQVQTMFGLFGDEEAKPLFSGDNKYDLFIRFGDLLPSDGKAELEEAAILKTVADGETALEYLKDRGWSLDVERVKKRQAEQREQESEANRQLFDFNRTVNNGEAL